MKLSPAFKLICSMCNRPRSPRLKGAVGSATMYRVCDHCDCGATLTSATPTKTGD